MCSALCNILIPGEINQEIQYMSRAFVKELDGDQADTDLPERPQSPHPNYITLKGFEQLKQHLNELRQKHAVLKSNKDNLSAKNDIKPIKAEISYLEKRVDSAIPVNVQEQNFEDIRFGASIKLCDTDDNHYEFTIVGEDEIDITQNHISWVSPLARALIGKRADDLVTWERPIGNIELEIEDFVYKS